MKGNKKLLLIMLSIAMLFCGRGYALAKSLDLNISQSGLTKISIYGDRIRSVFSDSKNIDLDADGEEGIIFLKPQDDKKINLTVLSELGESYILNLQPSNSVVSKEIILKSPKKSHTTNVANVSKEISRVIDLAHRLRTYKLAEEVKHLGAFKLEAVGYRNFKNFRVKVYSIENISDSAKPVSSKMFVFPDSVVAVAIDGDYLLESDAQTKLYTVERI